MSTSSIKATLQSLNSIAAMDPINAIEFMKGALLKEILPLGPLKRYIRALKVATLDNTTLPDGMLEEFALEDWGDLSDEIAPIIEPALMQMLESVVTKEENRNKDIRAIIEDTDWDDLLGGLAILAAHQPCEINLIKWVDNFVHAIIESYRDFEDIPTVIRGGKETVIDREDIILAATHIHTLDLAKYICSLEPLIDNRTGETVNVIAYRERHQINLLAMITAMTDSLCERLTASPETVWMKEVNVSITPSLAYLIDKGLIFAWNQESGKLYPAGYGWDLAGNDIVTINSHADYADYVNAASATITSRATSELDINEVIVGEVDDIVMHRHTRELYKIVSLGSEYGDITTYRVIGISTGEVLELSDHVLTDV